MLLWLGCYPSLDATAATTATATTTANVSYGSGDAICGGSRRGEQGDGLLSGLLAVGALGFGGAHGLYLVELVTAGSADVLVYGHVIHS